MKNAFVLLKNQASLNYNETETIQTNSVITTAYRSGLELCCCYEYCTSCCGNHLLTHRLCISNNSCFFYGDLRLQLQAPYNAVCLTPYSPKDRTIPIEIQYCRNTLCIFIRELPPRCSLPIYLKCTSIDPCPLNSFYKISYTSYFTGINEEIVYDYAY